MLTIDESNPMSKQRYYTGETAVRALRYYARDYERLRLPLPAWLAEVPLPLRLRHLMEEEKAHRTPLLPGVVLPPAAAAAAAGEGAAAGGAATAVTSDGRAMLSKDSFLAMLIDAPGGGGGE